MGEKFLVLAFITLIFLSNNLNAQENTIILSNNDADFTISKDTGLLLQIRDKINKINYLQGPSGLAYHASGVWHDQYNSPSTSPALLLEQTPKKLVFQKTEDKFIISYIYEITNSRLDLTTQIKYTENSIVNDFEARIFFGLDENIVNNYDVGLFIDADYINVNYKPYSDIIVEGIYTNTLYGGPDYIFFNKTNSGLFILLKEPIASSNWGGLQSLFWIYKNNTVRVPLAYILDRFYFYPENREKTIKISIILDKNLNNAKKKAFDYISPPPTEILGNWYITFPRDITDKEIMALKSNNYKFIQIHGWMPNYGVYPKSGSWMDFNGEITDVNRINNLIKKFQDNGMVAFLYFNAAEMQKDLAVNSYPDYIMLDKNDEYIKGYWIEKGPFGDKDKLYVMSLRDGAYKDYMLSTLSEILDTYEAKGIFIDRNDYQPLPDYNKNSPKYYFDKDTNKAFSDQNYNEFLKDSIDMIHSKGKYVILNGPRSMNYVPYADGIALDGSIAVIKYLYTSSLGKPFYMLPIHEGNPNDPNYNTNNLDLYPKLRTLLENPNVFYGSYVILDNNFNVVQIQSNNKGDVDNESLDKERGEDGKLKSVPDNQSGFKEETTEKINDANKIYFILIFLGILTIIFLVFKKIKSYKKIKEETEKQSNNFRSFS